VKPHKISAHSKIQECAWKIGVPSLKAQAILKLKFFSVRARAILKPKDLFATNNKRPDGMMTFPYMAWNFIVFDTVYTKILT
jgi:hypothetical protein